MTSTFQQQQQQQQHQLLLLLLLLLLPPDNTTSSNDDDDYTIYTSNDDIIMCILYICFCYDKSYTLPFNDPSTYFKEDKDISSSSNINNTTIRRKTIYFVRHGESTWNDTFNKGKHRTSIIFIIGFIPNLIKATLYEIYLLLSGKMDSWFYDAPLSKLGLQQVNELALFLNNRTNTPMNTPKTTATTTPTSSSFQQQQQQQQPIPMSEVEYQRHLSILRSDIGAPKSKLIASNLRRAVSTMIGGFYHQRLLLQQQQNNPYTITTTSTDKILIVPSLQEISSNPDTLCITPLNTIIQASWLEQQQSIPLSSNCNYQHMYNTQTDMSLHMGNKPLLTTNGYKRMMEFCHFIFSSNSSITEDYIIVGGHSLWFRSFFRLLLPYSVQHVAKEKKIVNGGIVVFDLLMTHHTNGTTTTPKYMIDPQSIQIIYGGF